jgi:D-alanine-D-alanine ligase
MKILILYSLPPQSTAPTRTVGEFDLTGAIAGLHAAIPEAAIAGVHGQPQEILDILNTHRPDVVFNACEAPLGRSDREAHVAALLEWANIPFTGSPSETLTLCRHKDWTKALLNAAGIPVPRSDIFPCIVKPAADDGSAGIEENSICQNTDQLAAAKKRLTVPTLVEEFLPGDEFTVSLWGKTEPEFHSIARTQFTPKYRLYSYTAKWHTDSEDFATIGPTYGDVLDPALQSRIITTAQAAWRTVNLRGYARIDLRQDSQGIPRVMDINPNPELGPEVSIARASKHAGWSWERFIRQQLEWALS